MEVLNLYTISFLDETAKKNFVARSHEEATSAAREYLAAYKPKEDTDIHVVTLCQSNYTFIGSETIQGTERDSVVASEESQKRDVQL